MEHTELQSPDYREYFNVSSVEEVLFSILSDVALGKLQKSDLMNMDRMDINEFPPVQYFYQHSDEFTQEFCQKMLEGIDSSEMFKGSEIYNRIMSDPKVIERFKKVSRDGFDFQPFWPNEYKNKRKFANQDEAVAEISKQTGKDKSQLLSEMPKLRDHKGAVQYQRNRSETREGIFIFPDNGQWEYLIYLDNGEVSEVQLPSEEKVSGWRQMLKKLFQS